MHLLLQKHLLTGVLPVSPHLAFPLHKLTLEARAAAGIFLEVQALSIVAVPQQMRMLQVGLGQDLALERVHTLHRLVPLQQTIIHLRLVLRPMAGVQRLGIWKAESS